MDYEFTNPRDRTDWMMKTRGTKSAIRSLILLGHSRGARRRWTTRCESRRQTINTVRVIMFIYACTVQALLFIYFCYDHSRAYVEQSWSYTTLQQRFQASKFELKCGPRWSTLQTAYRTRLVLTCPKNSKSWRTDPVNKFVALIRHG